MKEFSSLKIYTRRQAFLRVLKIFLKRTYCFPPNILSEAAIEWCCIACNLEKYILRTFIFKYQHCQNLKRIKALPLSKFQTNQGFSILKKHQEELNWYLLSTTPIYHRSIMLLSYVIQSCNMGTISPAFV